MLNHGVLISLVESLNIIRSPLGVCHGYSVMWLKSYIMALELGDPDYMDQFYSRERFIKEHYIDEKSGDFVEDYFDQDIRWAKKYFRSSLAVDFRSRKKRERAKMILDIVAFVEGLSIHHNPAGFDDIFGEKHFQGSSVPCLFQATQSYHAEKYFTERAKKNNGLDFPLGLEIKNMPPVGFKGQEHVFEYFSKVEKILHRQTSAHSGGNGFILSTNGHSIAVAYNQKSQKWCFMDINAKGTDDEFIECDAKKLQSYIYKGFELKDKEPCVLKLQWMGTRRSPTLVKEIKELAHSTYKHINRDMLLQLVDSNQNNLIHLAAGIGDLYSLKQLLGHPSISQDFLLNTQREDKEYPISLAIKYKHKQTVLYLIQQYLDIANLLRVSYIRGLNLLSFLLDKDFNEEIEVLLKRLGQQKKYDFKNESVFETIFKNFIFFAVEKGNANVIESLIAIYPRAKDFLSLVNARTNASLLYRAIEKGYLEVAQLILTSLNKNGSNFNPFLEGGPFPGFTPLRLATQNNQPMCVQQLLRYHSDPCQYLLLPDIEGKTVIHMAAQNGCDEIMTTFIKTVDDRSQLTRYFLNSKDANGETPLFLAAKHNHLSMVKLLLSYLTTPMDNLGLSSNAGRTPLFVAASSGFEAITQEILSTMASYSSNLNSRIEEVDYAGVSALYEASQMGYDTIVKLLLTYHSNPWTYMNKGFYEEASPLHISAYLGHHKVVEILCHELEHHPQARKYLEHQDLKGFTPLMAGAQFGDPRIVKSLLQVHPEPMSYLAIGLPDGSTPLYIACEFGLKAVVDEMAKVFTPHTSQWSRYLELANTKGATPLFVAAQCGKVDIVDCLLNSHECGWAYLEKSFHNGATPLLMSVVNEHTLCVNRMCQALASHPKANAYLERTDHLGQTALFIAAWKNNADIVKKLLATHSDPKAYLQIPNNKGQTALAILKRQGTLDLVSEIREQTQVKPSRKM